MTGLGIKGPRYKILDHKFYFYMIHDNAMGMFIFFFAGRDDKIGFEYVLDGMKLGLIGFIAFHNKMVEE